MKTKPARQVLQSFFGLERRETITRFIYAIITSLIFLDTIVIVICRWDTTAVTTAIPPALMVLLLLLQFAMFLLMKRDDVELVEAQHFSLLFPLHQIGESQ